MGVSVFIPTFKRPASLKRAVLSVFNQTVRPDEIIIVDNSPQACAQDVINALKNQAPCDLVYVHEPEAGVANARNKGHAIAKFARIASLDDDESAEPDWLKNLIQCADQYNADIVFGPVVARTLSPSSSVKNDWIARLYSRLPQQDDGLMDVYFGCGNCLIDKTKLDLPSPLFDVATNTTGGEDDVFFAVAKNQGAKFAWSNSAQVIEHVEDKRAQWSHILLRSFAYGQSPCQMAADEGKPLNIALWMLIGVAQFLLYAFKGIISYPISSKICAAALNKSVAGLGKLIWFKPFTPQFYGHAGVDT